MLCESCKTAHTAAGPPPAMGPPDAAMPDKGGDMNARLDALEQRVAALEDANTQSTLAALDASLPDIKQFAH